MTIEFLTLPPREPEPQTYYTALHGTVCCDCGDDDPTEDQRLRLAESALEFWKDEGEDVYG